MKFTHPEIDRVFDTECGKVNTLVIENQDMLCRLLTDLQDQIDGSDGLGVVSEDNKPVPCSKRAELLGSFVPFEINRKPLLTKLAAALEKQANEARNWELTGKLIIAINDFLDTIAFEFPCDIIFPKIGIGSIIKSAGPEFRDTYRSIGEKVIDYMELVRTFDRDKLFFTVNMRSFISDEEAERFMRTVLSHNYHVIMIESSERKRLPDEDRRIIDEDLCEID